MILQITIDSVLDFWLLLMFFTAIPFVYKALMAVDFSKLFKYNSTWQIRLLVLFLSVILAFLFSFAIYYTFRILYQGINK